MTPSEYQRILGAPPPRGEITLTSLGGGSLIVQTKKDVVLVDPFLSNWSSTEWVRRFPPMIAPREVDRFDALLITHEHEDHCDPDTVRPLLRQTEAILLAPFPSLNRLRDARALPIPDRRVVEVHPGSRLEIGDIIVRVLRTVDPLSKAPVGYHLQCGHVAVTLLGDSLYDKQHFRNVIADYPTQAAVVALGANPPDKKFYFSVSDVVNAASDADPSIVVPIHWDLWTKTYLDASAIPWSTSSNLRVLSRGEALHLRARGPGERMHN